MKTVMRRFANAGAKTARRTLFVTVTVFLIASPASRSLAALPQGEGRTIKDLSATIPLRVLQRSVSPDFYRSLIVSPMDGWIVVGGRLSATGLSGARIIRSSMGGVYDSLALKWAEEMRIAVNRKTGTAGPAENVLVHLLIYHIADGTMFVSFPSLEEPGGGQMKYFGCAKLSVHKKDGRWEEIKGPEGLQGKGWAVTERRERTFLSGEKLPRDRQITPRLDQR